jgi:hypothetical protein
LTRDHCQNPKAEYPKAERRPKPEKQLQMRELNRKAKNPKKYAVIRLLGFR